MLEWKELSKGKSALLIEEAIRTYMVVGGMPQAVNAFVDGGNYKEIDFVKRNILSLYEADLKKYDEDNREKDSIIFKTIPEVSLEAYADRSNFKLYMGDTGLLVTQILKNSDETAEDMIYIFMNSWNRQAMRQNRKNIQLNWRISILYIRRICNSRTVFYTCHCT